MKKYFLLMVAAICILLLVAPMAMADLINPTLGSIDDSQPDILNYLSNLYGDSVTLISKVEAGGSSGAVPGALEVQPPSPFGQAYAEVRWDLTGTGYSALYVVVKDGNFVDPEGLGIKWLYYTVTSDQSITSDGWQYVATNVFNASAGNISNIELIGVAVPEPGILILLGLAMGAIGVASWKIPKL